MTSRLNAQSWVTKSRAHAIRGAIQKAFELTGVQSLRGCRPSLARPGLRESEMSPRSMGERPVGTSHLFYDGNCGVCHMWVRFLLWADPRGEVRFAPLGGEAFVRRVPSEERERLPDSLVLVTGDGRLLTRSTAVLALLEDMGVGWRLLGRLASVVPRPLADAVYEGVARIRKRLAPKPSGACPIVPEPVRSRFDD